VDKEIFGSVIFYDKKAGLHGGEGQNNLHEEHEQVESFPIFLSEPTLRPTE